VAVDYRPNICNADECLRYVSVHSKELTRLLMTHESCEEMIGEALEHAKAGENEAANACFDKVIADCASESEPWMAECAAKAYFNKATVYRFASETDQAVVVFDELIGRFASAEDIALQRYVSMASYNKGVALQDAHRWAAAIDAFAAAISRGEGAADSVIRERVARSMFGMVQCYNGLEQPTEATKVLEDFVTRFGGASEPAIQKLIGPSILAIPRLLDTLPPAAHALSSSFNLAMEEDIRQQLADEPEVLKEYLETHHHLIAGDVARAAERHAQAVAVLEEHWQHGTPFALFLRNFDLEASETQVDAGEGMVVPISMTSGDYSDVESLVAGVFGDRIRAIGIQNPASFRPDVTQLIPKLELRNEVWEYALHVLLRHAAMIVVRLEHLTPGVGVELKAIADRKREDVAVVILPGGEKADVPSERFAGFALAVQDTELESPEIKALLQELISKALKPQ
jgi:tetratricopeptide (TPR) repeat protein